jgi:hypothetical protein
MIGARDVRGRGSPVVPMGLGGASRMMSVVEALGVQESAGENAVVRRVVSAPLVMENVLGVMARGAVMTVRDGMVSAARGIDPPAQAAQGNLGSGESFPAVTTGHASPEGMRLKNPSTPRLMRMSSPNSSIALPDGNSRG